MLFWSVSECLLVSVLSERSFFGRIGGEYLSVKLFKSFGLGELLSCERCQ